MLELSQKFVHLKSKFEHSVVKLKPDPKARPTYESVVYCRQRKLHLGRNLSATN